MAIQEKLDLEKVELELLLKAIRDFHGYDFHNYAKASLRRRVLQATQELKVERISELIPLVLHEPKAFDIVLRSLSINVTEMYRDPEVFAFLRKEIVPTLKTYAFIKIWHAACAIGLEAYSMAILLEEEGFLERSQIYATDYNNHSLQIAEKGMYPTEQLPFYQKNYQTADGKDELKNHLHQRYQSFKFNSSLKENLTFANHNLVADQSFGEMNLIFCRNVLIYFNRKLQNQVLQLLSDSLCRRGFLVLGKRETLDFSPLANQFEVISKEHKIYRKK